MIIYKCHEIQHEADLGMGLRFIRKHRRYYRHHYAIRDNFDDVMLWSRVLAERSLIADSRPLSGSPPLPVAHTLAIGRGGLCYTSCNGIASVLFLEY